MPDLIFGFFYANVPCNSSRKRQTPPCVPKSPSSLGDFWVGHTHLGFGQEPAFPSPLLQLGITGPLWFNSASSTQINRNSTQMSPLSPWMPSHSPVTNSLLTRVEQEPPAEQLVLQGSTIPCSRAMLQF